MDNTEVKKIINPNIGFNMVRLLLKLQGLDEALTFGRFEAAKELTSSMITTMRKLRRAINLQTNTEAVLCIPKKEVKNNEA